MKGVHGGVVRIGGLASEGVLVVWSSGIVHILSDRMHIHTIPLSGCIDRRSHYIFYF